MFSPTSAPACRGKCSRVNDDDGKDGHDDDGEDDDDDEDDEEEPFPEIGSAVVSFCSRSFVESTSPSFAPAVSIAARRPMLLCIGTSTLTSAFRIVLQSNEEMYCAT